MGGPAQHSVIDVAPDAELIVQACREALETSERADPRGASPYGVGASMAERVVSVLTDTETRSLRSKPFAEQ